MNEGRDTDSPTTPGSPPSPGLSERAPTDPTTPPATPESPAPVVLDCVFIETDRSQVSLVWRGTLPTPQPHLPHSWQQLCAARVAW